MIDGNDNAAWDKVVEYGRKVAGPTTYIQDALAWTEVVEKVLDCMSVL